MGFVYVWYDRKKKRYYIGSHWGDPDDGYICSSQWMRRAYNRRPHDFKRRIVAQVTESRDSLLREEQRWLDMIKPEEVRIRYYNIILNSGRRWHTDDERRRTVGQKISDSHRSMDPEKRRLITEKIWQKRAGRPGCRKGIPHTPEVRERISQTLKGRPLSEETRRKMSESRKGKIRGPYRRKTS